MANSNAIGSTNFCDISCDIYTRAPPGVEPVAQFEDITWIVIPPAKMIKRIPELVKMTIGKTRFMYNPHIGPRLEYPPENGWILFDLPGKVFQVLADLRDQRMNRFEILLVAWNILHSLRVKIYQTYSWVLKQGSKHHLYNLSTWSP